MTDAIVVREEKALDLQLDPASSYIARLAPGSRRTQIQALERTVAMVSKEHTPRTFPWGQMTYAYAQGIMLRLKQSGLKYTTINRFIAALRGVIMETWRLGLIDAETRARLHDAFHAVRGSSEPKGRMLEQGELHGLLKACLVDAKKEGPERVLGLRDAAMLALLRFGLRRAEVVSARIDRLEKRADGTMVLHIRGKGNKERVVPFDVDTSRILKGWFAVRPKAASVGQDPGTILTHADAPRALTPQAVYVCLRKRAEIAGIDPKTISPHDLRRTFISEMIDASDIKTAGDLVGHTNPKTTAGYDRRGERVKVAAVKHVKWGKKR